MNDGLEVDTTEWRRIATALKGADKNVKKAVNAGLRKVAKPAGEYVAVAAGSVLPRKGGLGYAVGGAKPGVTANPMQVTVRFNVPGKKWYLTRIDDGVLKHPVFGRPKSTVEQKVPSGSFRKPFDETAPMVRREMITALTEALDSIGKVT